MLLLALTVLLSGQPAYAHVNGTLYTGTTEVTLQAQTEGVDPKPMIVTISRDSKSVTFKFQWTNDPGTEEEAYRNRYSFVMGLDLNGNGVWQDMDRNKYTVDDTLVLWYLSYLIYTPPPCWVCLNFPPGLRVLSWESSSSGFQQIYGPDSTSPGPRYPVFLGGGKVIFAYSAEDPIPVTGGYSYTLTLKVPLRLFLYELMYRLESGFGFGLIQQTTVDGDGAVQDVVWVWPAQPASTGLSSALALGNPKGTALTDPKGAALLGGLNLWSKPPK